MSVWLEIDRRNKTAVARNQSGNKRGVIRISFSTDRQINELERLWGNCDNFSAYWSAAIMLGGSITYKEF